MNSISPIRLGLTLGLFNAAIHVVWVLLVITGLAQPLVNFFYFMHFIINPVIEIGPFAINGILRVIGVVLLAGLGGFVAGCVLGVIWNIVNRGKGAV